MATYKEISNIICNPASGDPPSSALAPLDFEYQMNPVERGDAEKHVVAKPYQHMRVNSDIFVFESMSSECKEAILDKAFAIYWETRKWFAADAEVIEPYVQRNPDPVVNEELDNATLLCTIEDARRILISIKKTTAILLPKTLYRVKSCQARDVAMGVIIVPVGQTHGHYDTNQPMQREAGGFIPYGKQGTICIKLGERSSYRAPTFTEVVTYVTLRVLKEP